MYKQAFIGEIAATIDYLNDIFRTTRQLYSQFLLEADLQYQPLANKLYHCLFSRLDRIEYSQEGVCAEEQQLPGL